MRLEINYKKKYKKHKHMEAKQCATKQTMDQWRKQNGNQKVSRGKWKQNKQTKKWQTKNYGTGKAVVRGSLQHCNYVSGNKKNLK